MKEVKLDSNDGVDTVPTINKEDIVTVQDNKAIEIFATTAETKVLTFVLLSSFCVNRVTTTLIRLLEILIRPLLLTTNKSVSTLIPQKLMPHSLKMLWWKMRD